MITCSILSYAALFSTVNSANIAIDNDIEEIVVTARKREEKLIDIPSSLSNITDEILKKAGAVSLKDISLLSPNLTMVDGQGMGSTTGIFIRGIGLSDSLQTFEQGVAVYVDGVPYPRMQGLSMRLFDVDNIQVLRGPQGTLFGKNAVGGALNIVTKQPSDRLSGQVEATYGTANHKQISAYISGPLSDQLSVSASTLYAKRDGYFQDQVSGKAYADDDSFVARIKLKYKPSDTVSLTLAGDLTHMNLAPTAQRAEDDVFISDVVFGAVKAHSAPNQSFDGHMELSLDDDAGEVLDQKGLSFTFAVDLTDHWSLKNIMAYRALTSSVWWDLDGTSLVIADVQARWDQDQLSNETQLNYTNGAMDAVFGAYYMRENSDGNQHSFLHDLVQVAGAPLGLEQPGYDTHQTTSYALFGHMTYQMTDRLNIEAGLRWSRDEKAFARTSIQQIGGMETGRFEFEGDDSWNSFTPSIAMVYKFDDGLNAYARIAKGFRSGGFNGRLSSLGDSESFKPETLWSYEAGLKYAKGNIQANMAAFYSDYTNFQTRISRYADVTDPTVGFNFPTVNAARLTIYGLEGDISANFGNFSLLATMGILQSDYGTFTDDSGDRSHNTPVFSPKLTAGITANYRLDFSGGSHLDMSASLKHNSGYFASVENTPKLHQDAYQQINIAAEWQSGDGYYIRGGVKNLTNKLVLQGGLEFRSLGNIQTGYYGSPRHWHLSAGVNF